MARHTEERAKHFSIGLLDKDGRRYSPLAALRFLKISPMLSPSHYYIFPALSAPAACQQAGARPTLTRLTHTRVAELLLRSRHARPLHTPFRHFPATFYAVPPATLAADADFDARFFQAPPASAFSLSLQHAPPPRRYLLWYRRLPALILMTRNSSSRRRANASTISSRDDTSAFRLTHAATALPTQGRGQRWPLADKEEISMRCQMMTPAAEKCASFDEKAGALLRHLRSGNWCRLAHMLGFVLFRAQANTRCRSDLPAREGIFSRCRL